MGLTPLGSLGSGVVQGAGSANTVVTLTAGAPAGALVAVAIGHATNNAIAGVTDSRGNTYAIDKAVGASAINAVVATSILATPLVAGDTLTITTAGAIGARCWDVEAFAGLLASPLDQTAGATGSGTTPGATTPATTQADELVLAVVGINAATSFAAGSGYTLLTSLQNPGSNSIALGVAYKVASATGTQTASGALGASTTWAIAVGTYKLGAGAALAGSSVGTSAAAADRITEQQPLAGASAGTSAAAATRITAQQPLAGATSGSSAAAASRITAAQPLAGAAAGTSQAAAALVAGAGLAGAIVGTSAAAGDIALPPPTPDPPRCGGDAIPGTTNMVPNPSAELDLLGIAGANGATVTRVATEGWDGTACVAATTAATAGSALVWATLAPLGITGNAADGSPRPLVGQVRLKGAGVVLDWVRLRAVYTDGSETLAQTDDAVPLTDAWQPVSPPPLWLDPAKTLDHAQLEAGSDAAAVTFRADGCQIEQAEQPSPFAIGSYGAPYHAWTGIAHRSPSTRACVPLDTGQPGHGGGAVVTPRLYRATIRNEWQEEVSGAIIKGTLDVNPDRAIKSDFRCTLTLDGYRALTPLVDYLAPVLRVAYPDGTYREDQLGLFVLRPSPETRLPQIGTVDVDGADLCWLLQAQGFSAPYTLTAGTNVVGAVTTILSGAGIPSWNIPASPRALQADMSWDTKTDKLKICNDLLEGIGYYTLWASKTGILMSMPYRDLDKVQPARAYAAFPAGADGSEIVGAVTVDPDYGKFKNNVIVVLDNPKLTKRRVTRTITHPLNPISITILGFTFTFPPIRRRWFWYVSPSDNAMDELAKRLTQELGSLYRRITLTVLPDPRRDLHEVYDLAIYDQSGDPVAVGKFWGRGLKMGFSPKDCTMTLTLAKVEQTDVLG